MGRGEITISSLYINCLYSGELRLKNYGKWITGQANKMVHSIKALVLIRWSIYLRAVSYNVLESPQTEKIGKEPLPTSLETGIKRLLPIPEEAIGLWPN